MLSNVVESAGYALRAWGHFDKQSVTPFAVQSLLILLGPILCAASVYMCLGRLIRKFGAEELSPIHTRWITKLFVTGDISCFVIQAIGGGTLSGAKSKSALNTGKYIILSGLVMQILIFLGFVAMASVFHSRLAAHARTHKGTAISQLRLLYAISTLIIARNMFRLLEYALGQEGYLSQHEWCLYVFDALLMTIVMALAVSWYRALRNTRERTEAYLPNIRPGIQLNSS